MHPPILHDLAGGDRNRAAADEPFAPTEQGDEAPFGERAVRGCSSSCVESPDALDLHVVLVGPHERHHRASVERRRRRGIAPPRRSARLRWSSARVASMLHRRAGWASGRRRPHYDSWRSEAHVSSHTTPSETVSPLPSSQSVTGRTPTPTTTRSASIIAPSASRSRSTSGRLRSPRPRHPGADRRRDRGAVPQTAPISVPSPPPSVAAALPAP